MANRRRTKKPKESWFEAAEHRLERLARTIAIATGRPWAFLVAVGLVLVWLMLGPFFHYDATWQAIISTGTTLATFLMVFLIQRAQNLDTMALQAKLAELIIAMKGAQNKVAVAENLSERELVELHAEHTERAEDALTDLERDVTSAVRTARKKAPARS